MELKNPQDATGSAPVIDADESALDASINETITSVQAERTGAANPPKQTVEATKVASSTEAPSSQEAAQATESQGEQAAEAYEFKDPVKGKFESQESFDLRVHLSSLVKEKKQTKDPSKQQELQDQIKNIRQDLSKITASDKNLIRSQSSNDGAPSDVQPTEATQNQPVDIDKLLDEKLISRQQALETKSAIDSFFEKHPEFKDQEVKDVFIDFFDANYKIEGKSAKEVQTVLDLARQAMFRPNETIQERVLKGAGVQEAVNAMQFPGGTVVRNGLTPSQQQSIDEMKAAGVPEDRARELILD